MRVPPVTSAPEHLGSTPRHKGASVSASLHVGQRGGRLSQGGHGTSARGIEHPPCVPLGPGALGRGVSTLGTGRGGEDGEEWLQRGSLLVPGLLVPEHIVCLLGGMRDGVERGSGGSLAHGNVPLAPNEDGEGLQHGAL